MDIHNCFFFIVNSAELGTTSSRTLFTFQYWLFYVLMLIDKFRGKCELRWRLLSLLWIQEHNLLVIGGCGSFMFPVEPNESFISAKENYHSNWLMAEKNSFHRYILFQFILSLHLHEALSELPSLVTLVMIWWCGQRKSSARLPSWKGEGIHPSYSVLTLIVIVHFNAKADCYGVCQNE